MDTDSVRDPEHWQSLLNILILTNINSSFACNVHNPLLEYKPTLHSFFRSASGIKAYLHTIICFRPLAHLNFRYRVTTAPLFYLMPAPSYGSSSRIYMRHALLPNTFGQVLGCYLLFLFNNLAKAPPSRHHQIRTHNRVWCSTDSPKPSLPI